MKFIHTADIHLDSPMLGLERYDGAPIEQLRQATRQSFDNLINKAIEEEVNFLVIAGDLYDGDWPDFSTGLYFTSRMNKLAESNIQVIMVSGNHDAQSRITKSLKLPPNVTKLSHNNPESRVFENHNVIFHGQSFATQSVSKNIAINYPEKKSGYINIGILHTSLDGREGHDSYAPCKKEDLLKKDYDYWALGHVHRYEVVESDPPIIFPGNIQGRNFRETGKKGCVLVSFENDNKPEIARLETDVARWMKISVDLNGSNDINDALEMVEDKLNKEIDSMDSHLILLRIYLEGTCQARQKWILDFNPILNQIRTIALNLFNDRVWIEQVHDRTRSFKSAKDLQESIGRYEIPLQRLGQISPDNILIDKIKEEITLLKRYLPTEVFADGYFPNIENMEELNELAYEARDTILSLIYSEEE